MVWIDRNGRVAGGINQMNDTRGPILSPDDKHILLERRPTPDCTNCGDLWLLDLLQGTNSFAMAADAQRFSSPLSGRQTTLTTLP